MMPLLLALGLTLLLAAPASAGEERDVNGALSRLSSASAGERSAAERELSLGLQRSHKDLLAKAARDGTAEVRARISAALSSDARHFALAADLAASADLPVARTGADAIAGQAAAWLGASDQEPMPMTSIEREVRGAFSGLWSLDVSGGELEHLLDQIARLVDSRRADLPAAAPFALVLDPGFDSHAELPLAGADGVGPVVVGSFDELVYAAAVTHGALFDVYGWHDGRGWIVVRSPASPAARPAQALLLEWVLEVQARRTPESAQAAARALASTGWPAALGWLDRRWSEEHDPAAFEALVLAAGRGTLTTSLASGEGARELLARADRALAEPGSPRRAAGELARALLTCGPLARELWAEGFDQAPARGRALRCALVASSAGAPAELVGAIEERLLAPDASPEERCALLRALAADPDTERAERSVPGTEAAFEWALAHGWGRNFPVWLRGGGGLEPPAWTDARGLGPRAQGELAADALARAGETPAALVQAGARLASLISDPDGEVLALAWLDRESLWIPKPRLRAALLGARERGANPGLVDRLLVCAALATEGELRAVVEPVLQAKDWTDSDWRVAGAAIAQPGGVLDLWPRADTGADRVYAAFLARLETLREDFLPPHDSAETPSIVAPGKADPWTLEAGWVQGCERALNLLRARQSEPGARELLRRLRVYFQRTNHPLRRELSAGRFPRPSSALIVELEAREPWLGF